MKIDNLKKCITNALAESLIKEVGGCFLDSDNILWKNIDGKWTGKRSVFTFELSAKWLEETSLDKIKIWWCGKDADYKEVFHKQTI
jgi:hypothetical protein